MGSTALVSGVSLSDLCKRPELNYENIKEIDENRPSDITKEEQEEINIEVKYEGYIERERKQVEAFKKMENKKIPDKIDYNIMQY